MKNIIDALKLFIILSILTGIIYPALITAIAQTGFSKQANGDEYLIAQKFDQAKYFWPRPSAVDYSTLPSGASNLSATSKALKDRITATKAMILASDRTKKEKDIPSDMLYASGSGIDPHISPDSAIFQADRVAKARKLDKKVVLAMIAASKENRQFDIFGNSRINVLKLNILLDNYSKKGIK
jgi:K+-transporting ATPase ATPase C chain